MLTKEDIHKVFVDDESYNHGHGKAYETYDINPKKGAMVIVRPDQCECLHFSFRYNIITPTDVSMVVEIENHQAIHNFFAGCTLPQK